MAEYNDAICDLYRGIVDQHGDDIKTLTVCVEKLTLLQEQNTKTNEDMQKRLTKIEQHPSRIFDKILTAIISASVSAVVTAIIAFLMGV